MAEIKHILIEPCDWDQGGNALFDVIADLRKTFSNFVDTYDVDEIAAIDIEILRYGESENERYNDHFMVMLAMNIMGDKLNGLEVGYVEQDLGTPHPHLANNFNSKMVLPLFVKLKAKKVKKMMVLIKTEEHIMRFLPYEE